jgi:hypothetical protein
MYYHCPFNNKKTSQSTFSSYSVDGLKFISNSDNIIHPYFRQFVYNNNIYGIAMKSICLNPELVKKGCKSISVIMKKENNTWIEIGNILPWSRHTCILVKNEKIYIFYTLVGDNPEHILVAELFIDTKDRVNIQNIKNIIKPELDYEHDNAPFIPSLYGPSHEAVRQLRDPYVFTDNNDTYILYSVCGEKGIALAKLII